MYFKPVSDLFLLLVLFISCSLISLGAARAQALALDRVYTPPVGSDERVQLMESVRAAMGSPTSKYKVTWLTVFHGRQGSVAVGTLDDVGAGLPVGTVFFERKNGKWNAQYLVATDGSTDCEDYASIQERIMNSSKRVGAPSSLFPPSFNHQYREARAGSSDSCMGFRVWGAR